MCVLTFKIKYSSQGIELRIIPIAKVNSPITRHVNRPETKGTQLKLEWVIYNLYY